MADLELRDVKKAYGTLNILHGINLDIKSGEFIVFVGPSGCGKSTLLRSIAGLEEITGGTLKIAGEVVNDVPPSKRGIAMVFQSYALYPHMTVYDNMAFGMQIAKESKAEIDKRVKQAAEILQLTTYLPRARCPKAMSGGQRQRVAIGRAIVRNPKVFLFDEPLSNLDAALRVATRIEIAKLKESMPNTTMIYVTHDQVEAMTLADRIVVLKEPARSSRSARRWNCTPARQSVRRPVHRLAGDEHPARGVRPLSGIKWRRDNSRPICLAAYDGRLGSTVMRAASVSPLQLDRN
jgi:multiple sugar transport system ATP-binding protein/alpha-glucoside transport system ATP-binding protein